VNQTLRRVFVMLCAGAGVWILVFWLYQPGDPTVTYGGAPVRSGGSSLVQLDTVAEGPAEPEGFDGRPVGAGEAGVQDPAGPSGPSQDAGAAAAGATTPPAAAASEVGAGAAVAPTLVPRVVAPEFWEYTVQRGDNSWDVIAEKTLGDRRLASAVLRANPLVSPDKLVPGRTRLKIPRDPRNIQGVVVTAPVGAEAPAANGDARAGGSGSGAAKPAVAGARTHTVAKGETLSQIAQKYLGSPAKWREIYEVNKAVIADPDRLKLGTVLKIPGG
jgi:nucleoid-associated protein YgaU